MYMSFLDIYIFSGENILRTYKSGIWQKKREKGTFHLILYFPLSAFHFIAYLPTLFVCLQCVCVCVYVCAFQQQK